jgi:hypothetical protein
MKSLPKVICTLAVAAAGVLGTTSAAQANSLEISAAASFVGSPSATPFKWTYTVFLTPANDPTNGNQINAGDFVTIGDLALALPTAGPPGIATEIDSVVTLTGGLTSNWTVAVLANTQPSTLDDGLFLGNIRLTYTGPTITGAVSGGSNLVLGTFSFLTADGFIRTDYNYNGTDSEYSGQPGAYQPGVFLGKTSGPATNGISIPTPLPAAFGPGGVVLLGLAGLIKGRRKVMS